MIIANILVIMIMMMTTTKNDDNNKLLTPFRRLKQEYTARYPVTELTATHDYDDYGQPSEEKLRPPGPTLALQSPQSVSEASTNEYATMRLLQRSAICAPGYCTDQNSAAPSATSQYTDHIYESPETMRRSAEPQVCFVGPAVPSDGFAGLGGVRMCQGGGGIPCQRYESPSRDQQLQQRTLANATGNYSL